MLGLKQLIFLPLKQLHTRSSRCNSSNRHEIVVSSRVSMEMRRRFRVQLRQSDPELQVCPIPRYLREQEVLTSRAPARPRPLLAHARHCSFTCVGKYFFCLSVIYSYEAFLCCCCSVSKVCCLESDHTGHDLLTAGSDT